MFHVLNENEFEYLCGFLSIFDLLSMELLSKQIRSRITKNKNIVKRIHNELRSMIAPIMVYVEDCSNEIDVYSVGRPWANQEEDVDGDIVGDDVVGDNVDGDVVGDDVDYSDTQTGWFKNGQFFAETMENITFRSRNGDDDVFVITIPINMIKCEKNKITIKENEGKTQLNKVFRFLRLLIWFCGGNNFSSPICITLKDEPIYYNEFGDKIHFNTVKNMIEEPFNIAHDTLKLSFNMKRKNKNFIFKNIKVEVHADEAESTDYLTNVGMKPFLIDYN